MDPTSKRRIPGVQALKRVLYEHFVKPFRETFDPVPTVAWGATIGMFIGLLPIMGIQMYVLAFVWVICRYVARFHFNLAIALGMVWISNPVTVLPLYFLYLETGVLFLHGTGRVADPVDWMLFQERFLAMGERYAGDWMRQFAEGMVFLFWEFGWPIVIGSVIWTIPLTVLTWPVTSYLLTKYRRYLARERGLSYEEWKARFQQPG